MKKLFFIIFLFVSFIANATNYYIAPAASGGSDSNLGTINSPWLTMNHAWSYLIAGDILYVRGGTYYYSSEQSLSGKSGTSGNYISIENYPGESPVVDGSGNGSMSMKGIVRFSSVSYIYMKGIRLTNLPQMHYPENGIYGLLLRSAVTHCTFEMCEFDHIGGWGSAMFDNIDDILYLNCDSHHNEDPYSHESSQDAVNYGGSDGWQCGTLTTSNVIFRGCRSWANSDDGWDVRVATGNFTWENCWSFWNGYIPSTIGPLADRVNGTNGNNGHWQQGGDGEGLKLEGCGGTRLVKNCLVFENYLGGGDNNNDNQWNYTTHVTVEMYNTIATGSQQGFNFEYGFPATVKNCIMFNNVFNNNPLNFQGGTNVSTDHNNFDLSITPVNADFMNTSSVGMDGARQSDGSLPVHTFLKLSAGSALRGVGAYVSNNPTDADGVTWNPYDLGPYKYAAGGATQPSVTTTAITGITNTTASSGGTVTSDGGASVTARGICWNTSSNPTTSNSTTSNGSGTGSFTSSLTGLTLGTTYYVRAYATNSIGTGYGSNVSFNTTGGNVLVTNLTVSSAGGVTTLSTYHGTLQFSVTSITPSNATNQTVTWSVYSGGAYGSINSSTGLFTASADGTVEIRGTANDGSGIWDNFIFTISNQSTTPTITTTIISSITQTTASSGGNVTSDGGASVTARGVCWGTSSNPTTAGNHTSNGSGTGVFTSSITGLSAGTTYYVRAYASNSVGTAYGSEESFTSAVVTHVYPLVVGGVPVKSGGKILVVIR